MCEALLFVTKNFFPLQASRILDVYFQVDVGDRKVAFIDVVLVNN